MSDKVVQFPPREPPHLFIGPFTENRVVVDGRVIPNLTGRQEGDFAELVLDRRFGITVPIELAHGVAWMIANALAIGAGYSHLGAETKDRPFAAIAMKLDKPPT